MLLLKERRSIAVNSLLRLVLKERRRNLRPRDLFRRKLTHAHLLNTFQGDDRQLPVRRHHDRRNGLVKRPFAAIDLNDLYFFIQ